MSEAALTTDTPDLADTTRLAAWLDERQLGTGAPLEHRFISGGSQNEIYEIRRGELHCALRIPPSYASASRDEGILREWRVISALDGTDVPHTDAIAVCTDPSVLGRTFYLMGFVDGWSPMQARRNWPAPFDADIDKRVAGPAKDSHSKFTTPAAMMSNALLGRRAEPLCSIELPARSGWSPPSPRDIVLREICLLPLHVAKKIDQCLWVL